MDRKDVAYLLHMLVLSLLFAGCGGEGGDDPVCGNSVIEEGEQCDDGDDNSDDTADACRTDCTDPGCGDGVTDTNEECDDGNDTPDDMCANDCTETVLPSECGDGEVGEDEECDDGGDNSDTDADACRTSCVEPSCGDGVTDSDEECDDGNDDEADECSNECTVIAGPECGDGVLDDGEECDEGEDNSDSEADTCRTNCVNPHCGDGVTDSEEECDDGEDNSDSDADACRLTCVAAACGDAVVDAGEGCDDGNDVNEDDCRNDCSPASCGDAIVDEAEACDDGNDDNTDDCLDTCAEASCGDGFLHDGVEPCDDGNDDNTDDCLDTCAEASCGDGFVHDGVEPCDDGNDVNTDDCLDTCVEASCGDGFVHDGVEPCDDGNDDNTDDCLDTCAEASCGDGFVHDGEEPCDDGNDDNTDDCLDTCAEASCGDGFVHDGEEPCDDGNDDNTDDCLDTCAEASCGDGFLHDGVEPCDDGNDDNTDDCLDTCAEASCGDGFVHDGEEECDDENDIDTDDCPSTCETARCGDGFVHDGEEPCDDGNEDNTDDCLDTCAEASCGDEFVHEGVEDCDDGNEDNTDDCLDTCDAASCGDGFVHDGEEECDEGDDNDAPMLGACSETCNLTDRYERVLLTDASGVVRFGDWDDVFERVTQGMPDCLLRFDGRVARPEYIEYDDSGILFDFHPLHAWHNSWDSFAYIHIQPGIRAGLGAAYRDGRSAAYVVLRSREQHVESQWHPMPVELFCERETAYEHVASFNGAGVATHGSWEDLHEAAATNAARCKVRFGMSGDSQGRIHPVPHVEYGDNWMNLDFMGLGDARHDYWDAYAYVSITNGARGGLGGSYRRGTWGSSSTIRGRDRTQHSESWWSAQDVDVYCADVYGEVYEIEADGDMASGEWDDLFDAVTDDVRDCRVVFDNRVSDPQHIGFSAGYLEFDFMNLHAWHDSWDAFALVDISHERGAGLRESFRRGHRDYIWERTSTQHAINSRVAMPVRVHCEEGLEWRHVFGIGRDGATRHGDREDFMEGMSAADTVHECRIRFSWRVTHPVFLDFGSGTLLFDYHGLSGYHNGHEAYATTVLPTAGAAGIAGSYRRGHADDVWRTDRAQYSLGALHPYEFDFLCR